MLRTNFHTIVGKDVFSKQSISDQVFVVHNNIVIFLFGNDSALLQVQSDIKLGKVSKSDTFLRPIIMTYFIRRKSLSIHRSVKLTACSWSTFINCLITKEAAFIIVDILCYCGISFNIVLCFYFISDHII